MKRTFLHLMAALALCAGSFAGLRAETDEHDYAREREERREDYRSDSRREYLSELREGVEMRERRDAHYQDTRIAEFQTGKDMIDMHGRRVRVEQYILRPRSDQYKHLIYNHREGRVDTAETLKTFNKDLPARLADAKPWDDNKAFDRRPEFFVTAENVKLTNGLDTFQVDKDGGKIYQEAVNSFKLLYDRDEATVNGLMKVRMLRTGQDAALNLKGLETYSFPNPNGVLTQTFSSNGTIHDASAIPSFEQRLYGQELHGFVKFGFADGTFLSLEDAWINDEGKVLTFTDLARITPENVRAELRKVNREFNVKASEFQGRDIDVVGSADILVNAEEQRGRPAAGF